ncbi:MAG: bacteriocin [Synechococcaceae cyanobacterium]
MAIEPSPPLPSSAGEELSEDTLQQINGGVAYATGRLTPDFPGNQGNLGNIGGIRPFNCGACVQGLPGDLIKNPAINQIINTGIGRL